MSSPEIDICDRMNWQEPCIVFCPHWSLRLGPAVHFLRRWCGDQNSLLILEVLLYTSLAFEVNMCIQIV